MTPHDLIARARARGVELRAGADGALLCRPRASLPDDLAAMLRAHRAAVVELLRSDETVADGAITGQVEEPVAWRLWSRLLNREIWICRDQDTAQELWAETSLPAFTTAEISAMERPPLELLAALANARAEFGPTGVVWERAPGGHSRRPTS